MMDAREVIARALCRSIDGNDAPSGKSAWHCYASAADAARTALEAAGMAIVPVEATEAMVGAFADVTGWDYSGSISDGYTAMIAAAKDQTDG